MTRDDIEKIISEVPSWITAPPACKNSFFNYMIVCQYDYDALTQAWAWFLNGWIIPRSELPPPTGSNSDVTEKIAKDGTVRKIYYGEPGEQPWDTMKREGWARYFAACNVLKYLRRTKPGDEAHGLESARWYYARLKDMADWDIFDVEGSAGIHDKLNKLLSDDERKRLL